MRGEIAEDKESELLSHMNGKTFEFFFERFTLDGVLMPEGSDFTSIKQSLIE